jgi:RNA polymerase sigma factor (sigma-70 family)
MSMRSSDFDEPSVLVRARSGDPEAFGLLFDIHRDRVFAQALRLTSSVHDAEDVTAVVFLEAWRRREAMREVNESVIGWLLVTTNHVFHNFSRGNRRYRAALANLPAAEHAPDHAGTVDDRLDGDAKRSELRNALSRLPRRDQDILVLCLIEELSTAAAAEVLGVAQGTVKSRLSRAKGRLTGLLGERHASVPALGGRQ